MFNNVKTEITVLDNAEKNEKYQVERWERNINLTFTSSEDVKSPFVVQARAATPLLNEP